MMTGYFGTLDGAIRELKKFRKDCFRRFNNTDAAGYVIEGIDQSIYFLEEILRREIEEVEKEIEVEIEKEKQYGTATI